MMQLTFIILLCVGHGAAAYTSFPASGESAEAEMEERLLYSIGASKQRVHELQEVLSPAFSSLPKNQLAKLEWPALRQLLHRHFVGEQGWHIKGLEPHRNAEITVDLLQKGRILGDALPRKLLPLL